MKGLNGDIVFDDVAVKVRVVFGLYIRLELRLNKNDS